MTELPAAAVTGCTVSHSGPLRKLSKLHIRVNHLPLFQRETLGLQKLLQPAVSGYVYTSVYLYNATEMHWCSLLVTDVRMGLWQSDEQPGA